MDFPRGIPVPQGVGALSANPAAGLDLPEQPANPAVQPTQEVRIAIQALHEAIAKEPDPEDKAVIAQCLQNLLRLQAKNQKQSQAPSR